MRQCRLTLCDIGVSCEMNQDPFKKQLVSARGPLSQSAAAKIIQRPLKTLQSWESGRRVPDRAIQLEAKSMLHKHFESP